METVLSIYRVSPDGAASLLLANIPFSNLQWNRRLSSCGDFSVQLAGGMPAPWPGRYLLARSDRPEVGVVEKCESPGGGEPASLSGRFAECLLDRRQFGPGGGAVSGANWRQAVTEAFARWPMPDAPAVAMGDGTEARTGSSYAIRVDAGKSCMDPVLAVAAAQSAYPSLSLDWAGGRLVLAIRQGVDRTRGQSDRPVCVFSVDMVTASAVSYTGDYSVARSSVISHATAPADGSDPVAREVPVPGFDPETMWRAVAAEDVGSLCSGSPTAAEVESAGALRAYDHMPSIAIENKVMGHGYGELWDLGDTVEADAPDAGVSCTARIEEVREVVTGAGATLEVQLGTKEMSRTERALARLR